jgi:hypothetical protein
LHPLKSLLLLQLLLLLEGLQVKLISHLITRGMMPCCSGMQCSALPVPIV